MSHRRSFVRSASLCASVLGLLLAAGTAHADTSLTISSATTKKTSGSSWLKESTKFGEFGAGVSEGGIVYTPTDGSSKKITEFGSFQGEIFDNTFTFAEVSLDGYTTSKSDTSLSGDANLSAFDTTLLSIPLIYNDDIGSVSVSVSIPLVKSGGLEVSATSSVSYSTTDFSACLGIGASYDYLVAGVFPVTVSAEADGCPGVEVTKHKATWTSSSSTTGIEFETGPYLDASLTVSAGVGTSAISAGAYGTVDLIKVSNNLESSLSLKTTTGALTYSNLGTVTATSLSGEAGVYFRAGAGLFSIEYDYPFIKWDGIEWLSVPIYTDSIPVATSVSHVVSENKVSGSYTFNDSDGLPDASTYQWYRGSTAISGATSKTYTLTTSDENNSLKFCVTPYNLVKTGTKVCSDSASIGRLAEFWKDSNYGSTNANLAYTQSSSGTCFKMADYSLNNNISSFKLFAPSYDVNYYMYDTDDCSDTPLLSGTVAANGELDSSSLSSSAKDKISSVRFSFQETVTASSVDFVISGNTAKGSYQFSTENTESNTESGSTYAWYRASSASGSSTVLTSTTSSTYTLTNLEDNRYLKFCVTPSNGYTTGGKTCSGWKAVGRLVKLYKDASYSGGNVSIAYEKSLSNTCFVMAAYTYTTTDPFGNAMVFPFMQETSSFTFAAGSGSTTLSMYKTFDCSGTSLTNTSASSSDKIGVSPMPSGWDNKVLSFKVTYTPTVTITTPSVVVSGASASASYSFSDTAGKTESDSQYTWYRASTSSGSASAISGATSSSYALTGADDGKYLKVCVTPSNGVSTGSTKCSSLTSVGNLLNLYSDDSYGGNNVSIAYDPGVCTCSTNSGGQTECSIGWGTCYNLGDLAFDNVLSSYKASGSFSNLRFYTHSDCVELDAAGTKYTGVSTDSDSGSSASSISSKFGSNYDNTISSFRFQPALNTCH
jgi:hypothetical protein